MKNKIIFLVVLLFLPLVAATSLNIEFKPHYYLEGYEVAPTTGMEYTDVLYEVIGINNEVVHIRNLTILDSYPLPFKQSLPQNIIIPLLRKGQTTTLWVTGLIPIDSFMNQTHIWIGVEGVGDHGRGLVYVEGHLNVTLPQIIPIKSQPSKLLQLGEIVWQGNSSGGILVFFVIFFGAIFLFWKYKTSSILGKWREKSERKRLEKRNASAYY